MNYCFSPHRFTTYLINHLHKDAKCSEKQPCQHCALSFNEIHLKITSTHFTVVLPNSLYQCVYWLLGVLKAKTNRYLRKKRHHCHSPMTLIFHQKARNPCSTIYSWGCTNIRMCTQREREMCVRTWKAGNVCHASLAGKAWDVLRGRTDEGGERVNGR